MLAIRLSRIGKTSQPSFRIILQEKTASPKGKAIEFLGSYDPKHKNLSIKRDRIEYFISKGAHPSSTLANLLKKNGLTGMDKYIKIKKSQKKKKKEAKAEAPKQEVKKETPSTAPAEVPKEEAKKETPKEEVKKETPKEEVKKETQKEEPKPQEAQ